MRKRMMLVMALCVWAVMVTGCALMEKRASLRTAGDTYDTTMKALITHADAGHLSVQALDRIELARVLVRQALDEWRVALAEDESPTAAIARYTEAMAMLADERLLAEGGAD